jgi:uncharacterized membrane protein
MVTVSMDGREGVPLGYLIVAAGLWAVSLWTRSVAARHLILLSLMLYSILFYVDDRGIFASSSDGQVLTAPIVLVVLSAAAFAFAVRLPELSENIFKLGGGLSVQGLLGFIAGMSVVQFELYEERAFTLVAVIVFAGVIAALVLAGRESRMLRWLAYAGFIWELGFVYVALLGSMLGTAGFFFVAGIVLAGIAWAISRIERRMAHTGPIGEGAA